MNKYRVAVIGYMDAMLNLLSDFCKAIDASVKASRPSTAGRISRQGTLRCWFLRLR